MPSYIPITPPLVFNKPSVQHSHHSTTSPPLFSTNSSEIPIHSSNPPTPAEQNALLTKRWLWVPHMKCSLLHDSNPSAIYIINHILLDGYTKQFFLRPLTNTSRLHYSLDSNNLIPNILEHELLPPSTTSPNINLNHHYQTQSLPIRPGPPEHSNSSSRIPRPRPSSPPTSSFTPSFIPSSITVGTHGQALGIGVSSVQPPFPHSQHSSVGSEFLYSPYGEGSAYARDFGNGRFERGDDRGHFVRPYYGDSSSDEYDRDRGFGRSGRGGGSGAGVRSNEKRRRGSDSRDEFRRGDSDRSRNRNSSSGSREHTRSSNNSNKKNNYKGSSSSEREDNKRRDTKKQGSSARKEGHGKDSRERGERRGSGGSKEKGGAKRGGSRGKKIYTPSSSERSRFSESDSESGSVRSLPSRDRGRRN